MNGLWIAPVRRCGNVRPVPSLALDFIANPVIPAGFAFSRASGATYFDATPVMQSAGNDTARFEHDPASGAPRGLLMESQRSNILTNSDQPETWTPYGVRVSTDTTLAPDGRTLARKITEDTSSAVHAVSQAHSITTSNATYSLWARLKAAELSIAQVMLTDAGSQDNCCVNFNLETCAIGTTYKGVGAWSLSYASCIPMAGGWVECRITGLVSSATTIRANLYLMQADQLGHSYVGDGVSGLYLGGAQMEAGTGTTYMPSGTVAAIRYADLLSTTGLAWLNPEAGTCLFDGAFNGVAGGGMFAFSLDDGVDNGIGIYKQNGAGGLNGYSTSTTGTPLNVIVADGQRFRGAIAWNNAGASASASVNGGAAIPIAGANPVTAAEFCIGSARNRQFSSNLWARSVTYWPWRFSDTDLAALTAMPPPTLLLDFIANPSIPSGFTFSRASAGTYYTASGLLASAGANVPRFDFDPASGAPLGLLLEASRENLLASSTGMSIATRCTLTQHDGMGADGSQTTTLITEDTTPASTHYASEAFPVSANVATTFSGYFRAGSRTQGCLFVDSAGWSTEDQALAIFDLSSATVVEQWNCTGGVQRINNGLLRGWLTATSGTTVSGARALAMPATGGQNNYNGAGGTIETWGWQAEPGNAPSSYMPTNGGTFTRAADCLTTNDLSFLDPQNGTLLIDGAFYSTADGGMYAFSLDDGIDNGIGIYKAGGSNALVAYSSTGANGEVLALSVADGQRFRAAIAWSLAGACASASANGLAAVNIPGAQALDAAALSIGSARDGRFPANLRVRSLAYWPYRIDDANLAALTAIPPT